MKAKQQRRLSDLFRVGREVTVGDDLGSITVWMQKLNPVEQEQAVRKAQAVRARFLAQRKSPDDELVISIASEAYDMDHNALVDYIVVEEASTNYSAIEARIAEENGWNENDYLLGLLDSWNGQGEGNDKPLSEVYQNRDEDGMDPGDVKEAENVWKELNRYNEEIGAAIEEERVTLRAQYEAMNEEALRDLVQEKLVKAHADIMWALEFRKNQLFYSVRDVSDHDQYYFENRDEINRLPDKVMIPLYEALNDITLGGEEGKGSPEAADSSDSSEQQEVQEESNS